MFRFSLQDHSSCVEALIHFTGFCCHNIVLEKLKKFKKMKKMKKIKVKSKVVEIVKEVKRIDNL